MAVDKAPAFFSYAREDASFALRLAADLKRAGANVWVDQLDIHPGRQWDREVERSLNACDELIVVLSPAAINSNNVMDEVAYALEERKTVIPLLVENCRVPFRLRRLHYVDFTAGYDDGLKRLLDTLRSQTQVEAVPVSPKTIGGTDLDADRPVILELPSLEQLHLNEDHVRVDQSQAAETPEEQVDARDVSQPSPVRLTAVAPHSGTDGIPSTEEKRIDSEYCDTTRQAGQLKVEMRDTAVVNWTLRDSWKKIVVFTGVLFVALLVTVIIFVRSHSTNGTVSPGKIDAGTNQRGGANSRELFERALSYDQNRDYAQAREWYEKAAAAGSAGAMNNLGVLYENGQGVAQDYAQARQWYEKAAAAGNADAMNNLGLLYKNGQGVAQDYGQARQWYEKAAAAGNSTAMYNVGRLYYNAQGVSQDYSQARYWYKKAAETGDAAAMTDLGWLFDRGLGVETDYEQARQWYEKAAAAGNGRAMNNLGVLYGLGRGIPEDDTRARQWYERAAAAGDVVAMKNLGTLYERGKGVAKDYAQARQWYEQAAARGNATAMKKLGDFYEYGRGVAKDTAQARQWYEKAAAAGSDTAKLRLKVLND